MSIGWKTTPLLINDVSSVPRLVLVEVMSSGLGRDTKLYSGPQCKSQILQERPRCEPCHPLTMAPSLRAFVGCSWSGREEECCCRYWELRMGRVSRWASVVGESDVMRIEIEILGVRVTNLWFGKSHSVLYR